MRTPSPWLRTAWQRASRAHLPYCLALALLAGHASAGPTQEDQDAAALARAAVPDTTPAQVYDTARREAYGAFHEAQRDCQELPKAARRICLRDAQQQLDADLRAAAEQRKAAGR